MVPETNTIYMLIGHMSSPVKEIKIPALRTIACVFLTENPDVIDYTMGKNLLQLLNQISIEFRDNDEVQSEICYCLRRIILTNCATTHRLAILQDNAVWCDVILFGLTKTNLQLFNVEAVCCVDSMFDQVPVE
jgi:hypothetical protein